MALNGWPQLIFEYWSKEQRDEEQPENLGPHASQIGNILKDDCQPSWTFFVRLGDFNYDVVNNANFDRIRDVTLRERLRKGKPFVTDSGRVATDRDFFGMLAGSTAVPNEYVVAAIINR